MTREEAVKNLIDHKTEFTNDFGWNTSVIESLEMAIAELKRQAEYEVSIIERLINSLDAEMKEGK